MAEITVGTENSADITSGQTKRRLSSPTAETPVPKRRASTTTQPASSTPARAIGCARCRRTVTGTSAWQIR